MGEATATPSVKANHSSAKRASQGVLRKVCNRVMGEIIASQAGPENDKYQICSRSRNTRPAILCPMRHPCCRVERFTSPDTLDNS